ncbi:MAG: ribonuclease P protein component [Mogibacterium sp.]|jgi:ribonuclease P protein component|nr:ribonuclease P protein component [Mogibacterium sp.]
MRDHSELTLRKQSDFSRVYKQGKSRGSRFAVILYKRNGLKFTRTAFVASKKVGNSVQRNRSRRLMRAAYRAVEPNVKRGYDIIFVARAAINGCKEPEVERQLKKTLEGAGILTGSSNEK